MKTGVAYFPCLHFSIFRTVRMFVAQQYKELLLVPDQGSKTSITGSKERDFLQVTDEARDARDMR